MKEYGLTGLSDTGSVVFILTYFSLSPERIARLSILKNPLGLRRSLLLIALLEKGGSDSVFLRREKVLEMLDDIEDDRNIFNDLSPRRSSNECSCVENESSGRSIGTSGDGPSKSFFVFAACILEKAFCEDVGGVRAARDLVLRSGVVLLGETGVTSCPPTGAEECRGVMDG